MHETTQEQEDDQYIKLSEEEHKRRLSTVKRFNKAMVTLRQIRDLENVSREQSVDLSLDRSQDSFITEQSLQAELEAYLMQFSIPTDQLWEFVHDTDDPDVNNLILQPF
jgi:hypothetical protein